MIEYKDMHWEGGALFLGKKDTSIRLVQDGERLSMYWLVWNFGKPEKSINFYNLTNAKDNARTLYMRYRNNSAENGPTEARRSDLND